MAFAILNGFWNWYLMRLLPGVFGVQTPSGYYFSLLLVFLLTFTAEFCSKYPIGLGHGRGVAALGGAALQGLKMFMIYLAIIAILATDFVFFLAAVAGHVVGNFIARVLQYEVEQAECSVCNCSCGGYYAM